MLVLLKISNVALIDEVEVEFSEGLNLLTGETGSGKSIIVDSLGALIGERVSSDIIKDGKESAQVEGLFVVNLDEKLKQLLGEGGFEIKGQKTELIIRREIYRSGRTRNFVNNQLVTQSFLRKLGNLLADIHGQGDQASLFDPENHLEILDEYADLRPSRNKIERIFAEMSAVSRELEEIRKSEAQKLQMLDILRFQIEEIKRANLNPDEEENLLEERKRLLNVEKLSELSETSYGLLYENEEAVVTNLEKVVRQVEELSEYDSNFKNYLEDLHSTVAMLEDLASSIRTFKASLDFSSERLEEIESKLSEISRLKRKYGGSIKAILKYLEEAEAQLMKIENMEIRQEDLVKQLNRLRNEYLDLDNHLHNYREKAARKFEEEVEANLKKVALEKARFKVIIEMNKEALTAKGFDKVEFYFSANVGESLKPLVKVASGGEASRLMLILKTTAKFSENPKTIVFDEIDIGVGGRVAEAVGLKLRELSSHHQVLCVTHQPQIVSLADHHFLVEKKIENDKTKITVRKLDEVGRIAEIARMLAGEKITETAEEYAKELLKRREV